MKLRLLFLTIIAAFQLQAQDIPLKNASFEGIPRQGVDRLYLLSWYDCGQVFRGETPPDIHPIKDGLWGNFKEPNDGTTYVGLVARDNDTYEGISQQLSDKMLTGQCYEFSISIARNDTYLSGSRRKLVQEGNRDVVPYTQPIVLRIWGGNKYGEEQELLAESAPIDHNDWMSYKFNFKPSQDYLYFTLSAFYKVPALETYNGHILIDNASDLKSIPCPSSIDINPIAVTNVEEPQDINVAEVEKPKPTKKIEKEPVPKPSPEDVVVVEVAKPKPVKKTTPKPKINLDLDGEKVKKGQVIKLEKLFFDADVADINRKSYETLDELFAFMQSNPKVKIEVGGHTNGQPSHEYCDKLSQARADAVTKYLVDKGIDKSRIQPVGYGKRKPIASNQTIVGRQRNQRVEVKILDL